MSLGNNLGDFVNAVGTGLYNFRFMDAIDIILMTLVFFWLVSFFKRMGAAHLLRGLLLVVIASYLISNVLDLTMLSWLIDKLLVSGIAFIAVLFQPELRRALDHLGRQRRVIDLVEQNAYEGLIRALKNLAKRNTGALVLVEKSESLQDIVDSGVRIDSVIAAELIENIFEDKTPLHDGAIVIRNQRIEAAACIIPLASNLTNIPQQFGTRHRAAVSATLKSDCIAIIVSEETGRISYAKEGILHSGIDAVQLTRLLEEFKHENVSQAAGKKSVFKGFFKLFSKKNK